MKMKLDFEQFIDMLLEAKKTIEDANALEHTIEQRRGTKSALDGQIATLTQEAEKLSGSVGSLQADLDKEFSNRRSSYEVAFQKDIAAKHAEMQRYVEKVESVKKSSETEIQRLMVEQEAVTKATEQAKTNLIELNEALERSRKEATTLARLVNVGRA